MISQWLAGSTCVAEDPYCWEFRSAFLLVSWQRGPDRLSARWLLAVAARLVRDVGALITGATQANRRLATFALDGEVRFASAADRAAFAEELTQAVSGLVAKYHDETAVGGRDHRIVVAVHPSFKSKSDTTTPQLKEL